MKRLLSTLGLAALLGCEPAEEEVSQISVKTVEVQQGASYPHHVNITGILVYSKDSTAEKEGCAETIMYVGEENSGAISAFCFPHHYMAPQYSLLPYNLGNTFHCEGNRIGPLLELKHPLRDGKVAIYNLMKIEVKREFSSHLELENKLRSKVNEENFRKVCQEGFDRYFVEDQGTLLTVCADIPPTDGIAHRIDYRKDEIGQPTYRVE